MIVRAHAGGADRAMDKARDLGGTIERRLGVVNGFSASVPSNRLGALRASDAVAAVTPNGSVRLQTAETEAALAPNAGYDARKDPDSLFMTQTLTGVRGSWDQATGAGIDIALIDSGITPVAGLSEPGKVVYGPDLTEESQNPNTARLDTFGHGTHMASIIAGRDGRMVNRNDTTSFLGVAPNARLVSVKVANAMGTTDVSQVIAGLDWVVQHARDPGLNIRVVSLSFGTDASQSYLVDPLSYAVGAAWHAGIVAVVSAGNRGTTDGRLTNPAVNPFVIAVGAADLKGSQPRSDDTVPAFSSVGDGVRNPDLVAPGVHVQGLRVPGSRIDTQYGGTAAFSGRFFRGSGTSQAAAFVAGCVALLLERNPSYPPDRIKAMLTSTAVPVPATTPQRQGAGLLDMGAALNVTRSFNGQGFTRGVGGGSLESSRGSFHISVRGVALTGEKDIMGRAVDTRALAAAESTWSS